MSSKKCTKCGIQKDLSEFYKRPERKSGYHSSCKKCSMKRNEKWRQNNKEKAYSYNKKWKAANETSRKEKDADTRYKKKYGIDTETVCGMLESQGGCAICGKRLEVRSKSIESRAVVDHCHDTGRVRGILCNNCNTGIGHLKDDPDIVKSALDYLIRHKH